MQTLLSTLASWHVSLPKPNLYATLSLLDLQGLWWSAASALLRHVQLELLAELRDDSIHSLLLQKALCMVDTGMG